MTDAGGRPWAMPEPDAPPGSGPMDDEDLTDVATAAEMAGFTAGPPTLEFVA
ncbi:MAG: hypothetical protein H0W00_00305, partial [Chloroflexi bacterium]|nr:hypothetical protein [Chloroflexota bacterium]